MLPYIPPSSYGEPDRIRLLASGLNVQPLADALTAHPELWDQQRARTDHADSPHRELSDIWARYAPLGGSGGVEHESIWYPNADHLPIKVMADELMAVLGGAQLGGVLITRIPPGAQCHPHVDNGWHAEFYDKFAVQVKAAPGQTFHFEGQSLTTSTGDLYWFSNQSLHWVTNDSDSERITAIFCIKPSRLAQEAYVEATPDALQALGVGIEHHFIAKEIYAKRAHIKAGSSLVQHTHPYDHAAALVSGTVRMDVDGLSHTETGPKMLLITAGQAHGITALTDVVWHCLHITADTDPMTVDATILKG